MCDACHGPNSPVWGAAVRGVWLLRSGVVAGPDGSIAPGAGAFAGDGSAPVSAGGCAATAGSGPVVSGLRRCRFLRSGGPDAPTVAAREERGGRPATAAAGRQRG